MRIQTPLFGALALGSALVMLFPVDSPAQAKRGGKTGQGSFDSELDLSQRDVRVFNNFADPEANNNVLSEANFPGALGATQALWKAAAEWGSSAHGTAPDNDTTQSVIGDGRANFDTSFQGNSTNAGSAISNIMAAIPGSEPGVLAFTTADTGGWRISFYETGITWEDGPGAIGGGDDLQGVGCHQFGHALGLNHSTDPNATMFPVAIPASTTLRSINATDRAAIQAVYGAVQATKPRITAVAIVGGGTQAQLTGINFAASGNEVWFTQKASGGSGEPIKAGATSPSGTSITVTIPAGVGRGNVLVKVPGSGFNDLSNAWPFDAEGPVPQAPSILSISPTSLPALTPDNTQDILLTGTQFITVTSVLVDGVPLGAFPPQWSLVSLSEISMHLPLQTALGDVEITVQGPAGSDSVMVPVVEPPTPTLRINDGKQPFEDLFSIAPFFIKLGGHPGETHFLFASGSLVPSSIPALFTLGIGAGFTNLFQFGNYVIPPQAWTQAQFQFSGLPFGTQIHFQAITFDPMIGMLPAPVTNIVTGQYAF